MRQRFGDKYELIERIATGGMAEIYRADLHAAAGITKPVVIKKILPHFAGDPSFIRMFEQEARIVVQLAHGNIAQVFDFGEIDGEWYLAMEHVHGQPLSMVIERARAQRIEAIPEEFALYVAMELCKGLHYAHTHLDERNRPLGLVHRDVSPQNVIVGYDGQVKIVDFGIARAHLSGRIEAEPGHLKGKFAYFSPEQARSQDVDARTDIFASGVVLYEMLCGRLPFEGRMVQAVRRIARGEFPRPRELNPDLSESLERILLSAMAAQRESRFPTALAFEEALAGELHAHAPSFSGEALAQFMAFLFEPELAAEGKRVQLPRAFTAQLPFWRKTLPLRTPPAPDRAVTEKVQVPRLASGGRWPLVATALTAASLAALAVLSVRRTSGRELPSTAVKPPGSTTVPVRGEREPGPPRFASEAAFPVSRVEVFAAQHALGVPSSRAARIRLNPKRTYEVWTDIREAMFFLEGTDRLPSKERFGTISAGRAGRLVVHDATALYAFLVNRPTDGDAETILVWIRERGSGTRSSLLLDPKAHSVALGRDERFQLVRLDPERSYELSLREGAIPARIRAGDGGRPGSLVALQGPGGSARVLEIGKSYQVSGVREVSFTFPDDGPEDNEGSVIIDVRAAPDTDL